MGEAPPTHHRYVTEMGMGVDVHGGDYTKAACRAVSDAIRHSSLNFFRNLGLHPNDMQIRVLIGVAQPEQIDLDRVAAELPYGEVTVIAVPGGLDVPAQSDLGDNSDTIAMANAAVIVSLPAADAR